MCVTVSQTPVSRMSGLAVPALPSVSTAEPAQRRILARAGRYKLCHGWALATALWRISALAISSQPVGRSTCEAVPAGRFAAGAVDSIGAASSFS